MRLALAALTLALAAPAADAGIFRRGKPCPAPTCGQQAPQVAFPAPPPVAAAPVTAPACANGVCTPAPVVRRGLFR